MEERAVILRIPDLELPLVNTSATAVELQGMVAPIATPPTLPVQREQGRRVPPARQWQTET